MHVLLQYFFQLFESGFRFTKKFISVAECSSYGRNQCNKLKSHEETLRKQGIVSKRDFYTQPQDDKLQLYHLSLGVLEATAAYRNGMGYGSHAGYA